MPRVNPLKRKNSREQKQVLNEKAIIQLLLLRHQHYNLKLLHLRKTEFSTLIIYHEQTI